MQTWLEHCPFVILSTMGQEGIDCSARGDDAAHAFQVLDEKTIAIPDRRGNNRIDSLKNIIEEPRVGLLCLLPGVQEIIRIKGEASISIEPELLQRFTLDDIRPATVIVITIHTAFVQNARAIRHASLWSPEQYRRPENLPDANTLSRVD